MTETRSFQAEVSRLLDIVAHSLYSDKKVFLRELISNASDACDRRRYAALTDGALAAPDGYRVLLIPDEKAGTLTVSDNGIGMTEEELAENLGTIARSGTAAFAKTLGQDDKRDMSLIGQFGVGFYSSFMVADRVEVISRKAGAAEAHKWESDGKGSYTIGAAARDEAGTTILLHLREGEKEFLAQHALAQAVRNYADHIPLPVILQLDGKEETLNTASALWTRSKSELTPEQYNEFYRTVGHGFDDPWLTLHWKAEGMLEYTGLLFVPSTKPFDLFDPARRHNVRLYVRRVFVTDEAQDLLPGYLRFLKGVVDSEDLPLNISRETLQANPMIARIRQGLVKRVLGDLAKKATDAPEEYAKFWENFGAVLKEGLYEDFEQRQALLGLARFRSTAVEGLTSLEDYVKRMKMGQKHIFTIAGDEALLAKSPQLEGFRAKGVEVLLLTDPVDEFWIGAVPRYEQFDFKSVTRGAADLSEIEGPSGEKTPPKEEPSKSVANLVAMFKITLTEAVKDVRISDRLTESPVCLVADEGDTEIHLQRLLKQHNRSTDAAKPILELNASHPLIASLSERLSGGNTTLIEDAAWLLLDQARVVEGEPVPDPVAFAQRLSKVLARGLAI